MYEFDIKCIEDRNILYIKVYCFLFVGEIEYYKSYLDEKFKIDREEFMKCLISWIKNNVKNNKDLKYLTLKESYFKKKVNKFLDKIDKNLIEWE